MKGIWFPLHTILITLTLYFLNNTSTRAISQFLRVTYQFHMLLSLASYINLHLILKKNLRYLTLN